MGEAPVKRSTQAFLTTHMGSLPRPHAVVEHIAAKFAGEPFDPAELDREISDARPRCRA